MASALPPGFGPARSCHHTSSARSSVSLGAPCRGPNSGSAPALSLDIVEGFQDRLFTGVRHLGEAGSNLCKAFAGYSCLGRSPLTSSFRGNVRSIRSLADRFGDVWAIRISLPVLEWPIHKLLQ